MALINRTFEITQEFEAFNPATGLQRTFSTGEKIQAVYDENKTMVQYQGFNIPAEYVNDLGLTKSILMLAGIGVAFLIIAFLIYWYFKNRK